MYSTMTKLVVLSSLLALFILASCGGGGGNNFPIDQGGQVLLASGAGVVFPAGTFAGAVEVTVTEDIPAGASAAASYPANAGNMLGALDVKVPADVAMNQNIEVRIAVGNNWDATKGLVIFTYDEAAGMWETTEAATTALRGTAAVGTVKDSNVVSFTAATAGTTGFGQVYGVFDGYTTDNGGGGGTVEPNHIPTVTLAADDTEVEVGDTVNLTATAADTDGDTLAYNWAAAGGTLAGATDTAKTWSAAAAGVYTVSVTVNDGNGGVAVASVNITVGNPPEPNDPPEWHEGDIAGDVAAPVVGQKVWLTGVAADDPEEETVTYTWSGPGAFADETMDEHGIKVFWTPDAEGAATVTLTASDGVNDITKTFDVTVAAYPTDFDFVGYATCLACHADQGDETAGTGWFATNHSDAIQRNLSDPTNAHAYRNPSCYNCHALGWEPNDSGQGFIDIDLTPEYANIQCESCHGGGNPAGMGAGHKGIVWNPLTGMVFDETEGEWLPDDDFDSSNGVGCGVCHEGARHGAVEQWAESGHANFPLTEGDPPAVNHDLTGASCSPCHNGMQFAVIHRGDDPIDFTTWTVDDPLEDLYISCATCHDPHDSEFDAQLRVDSEGEVAIPFSDVDNVPTMVMGGMGNICIECHNGRRDRGNYDDHITEGSSHFGPHGNPQGAMFFGLMGADLGVGAAVGSGEYEYVHPHLTWNDNTCVSCHMYRQPYISSEEPASFGHTFEPDFRNCIKCHTNWGAEDEEAFWLWVEEFQTNEIEALLTAFEDAWPAAWHGAEELTSVESSAGAGDGPPELDPVGNAYRAALWNYFLVLNDATLGVHNPTFTKDLLMQAIASVEELNAL